MPTLFSKERRKVNRDRRALAAVRGGHGPSRWVTGAGVVVVVVFAAVLVMTITRNGVNRAAPPAGMPAAPITTADGLRTPPPWPAPSDAADAVKQAGLPMLGAEGAVQHFHAHLDVVVNGQPVVVPADIGIDQRVGRISPLHTHDATGVIHVESPEQATFSLAQLFSEWQVNLSASQVGGLNATPGSELRAYVNGKQVSGNPGAVTLLNHDEVALVYGPAPTPIPGSYDFGRL
jgi:hypothetical protein